MFGVSKFMCAFSAFLEFTCFRLDIVYIDNTDINVVDFSKARSLLCGRGGARPHDWSATSHEN